jgi:hypothetical protein
MTFAVMAAPSFPYRLQTYWQEAVCSEADAGAAFSSMEAAVCGDGKSAGISAGRAVCYFS